MRIEGALDPRKLLLVRALFVLAAVGAFVLATSPYAIQTGANNKDKFAHILAFYSLTLLAAMGWPSARLLTIGIGMSLFGGVIEIVQGLPFVGRDQDFWDWIADTAAVAAALVPLMLARLRTT